MVTIRDKDTSDLLGTISEEELEFLIESFEEESSDDTDYYIDADTIEMLEGDGASPALLELLRKALGSRDGVEISWARS